MSRRPAISDRATAPILYDILATEISPELVPAGADGAIQSTESVVGPYALQDFNLFYTTRYGFRPSKIAYLSWNAWHDVEAGRGRPNTPAVARRAYSLPEIKHWLRVFLLRFFQLSQFKRSALPNGPKISSGGSLSPRGDWRAPSDSEARRSGSPNSTTPFPTRFEGPLGGSRARIAQPKRSRGQFLINSYKM